VSCPGINCHKYILGGYRLEKADYLEIFTSLTFLHNETRNVYTHLVGALLLPLVATAFLRHLEQPEFLNILSIDYTMIGIYLWCGDLFGLKRTLPPGATPLTSRRTVLRCVRPL
jgi:hypothetical protein